MRVVVTGSRKQFKDSRGGKALIDRLFKVWDAQPPNARDQIVIATGECKEGGADLVAKQWAKRMGVKYEPFPVHMSEYLFGKFGPFIRNARMLRTFKPDLVIAVSEWAGNGTRHCANTADIMGIKVEWV